MLLLTHRFPYPPNRGDRIRSYNLMRVLAEHFDVTLACPHDEPITDEHFRHVDQICRQTITAPTGNERWLRAGGSVLRGRSLTEGLFHHAKISSEIRKLQRSRPFDAVLVFCSGMFRYIDGNDFTGTPIVVDLVDVDSMKWEQLARESRLLKRPIYAWEANRVKRLEQRIARRADAITLVSDDEANAFRGRVTTKSPIIGVSNGVDTDYFRPRPATSPGEDGSRDASGEQRDARNAVEPSDVNRERTDNEPSDPNSRLSPLETRNSASHSPLVAPRSRLIFTGVLDYPPNVEGMRWFCNDILPGLRERLDVELQIVGRRPNQVVRRLGELEGVTLIGEVPDVRPYLLGADIAVSPLKLARGIQNKVLEAMASGLPVITTSQSAEGIDAESGEQFIIADSVGEWQDSIHDLFSDAGKREGLGRQARQLVVDQYSWSARLDRIIQLLRHSSSARASR